MKSVPWGLTFNPGPNASHPCLFHFTVLVTLVAFWFVDFTFLSLFSQEAVKAAGMCVYMCVCDSKVQFSSLGTSPVESVSFSAVVLWYITRCRSLSIQAVTILSTTFLKTWRAGLFTV